MDTLRIIDQKIEELILDNQDYNFEDLKSKVENILKSVDLFLIENQLNSKAVDMYLKSVITQRNKIKKEQDKRKIKVEDKYSLIESICKKLEFKTQEELIKKIESLEKMTIVKLQELNNSL